MDGFNNKWFLVGFLGVVFLITLKFSYGTGYGGNLLALVGVDNPNSQEMSPSDTVTPVVTPKSVVTFKNVTTVTSVSPVPSNSFDESTPQAPLPSGDMSPVPDSAPTTQPTPPEISPMSPTPVVTSQPPPNDLPTAESPTTIPQTETTSPPPPPASEQSTKININTAGLSELDKITGIGPVLAQRIIDYRTANGPFQEIEDIINVKGIGDKTFETMKDQITV